MAFSYLIFLISQVAEWKTLKVIRYSTKLRIKESVAESIPYKFDSCPDIKKKTHH
jgi:hypothetical protein